MLATWFEGLPGSARLNCNPETSVREVGAAQSYLCTVLDVRNDPGTPLDGWEIDAENMSPGVNDPDDSAKGSTADYDGADATNGCVTGETSPGKCRMTIASESPAQAGLARICFWVDEENDASFHPEISVEWDGGLCDTENVDAPEKDNRTDLVALYWKLRRTISLSASRAKVRRGGTFKLSGVIKRTSTDAVAGPATCVAAQRVVIRRDVLRDGRPNEYSALKSVKSGRGGRYSAKVTARRSARYRATVAPTTRCFKAASPARRVRVRTRGSRPCGRSWTRTPARVHG
ncbi:MAG: hypothetical protein ABR529_11940 [Actinomycetota bacterium]